VNPWRSCGKGERWPVELVTICGLPQSFLADSSGNLSMNIKEVAKRAKVSTATVSRTINEPDKVRPRTAERVRRVIEELNFYPNTHARTLVSGRSRMLGLIISDITNPFFPELVKNFEDQAMERGQEVIISNTDYNPKRMAGCIQRMLERKVDGVAIMTSETEPQLLAELARRGVPTVLLDTATDGPKSVTIRIDYAQGIREAVDHLVTLHHDRIAFISGPLHLQSARARYTAFLTALRAHGIVPEPNMIEEGDHRIDGGAAAMNSLLRLPSRPTAVIASNDLTAIGALGVMYEAGLKVPDDISLVGFDDILFAQLTQPPLTTVRVSRAELAVTVFAALEKLAHTDAEELTDYTISTHLVERRSTAPARLSVQAETQELVP
jgi:DNA-binding LacI/PurR family transcriptional regulator